MKHPFLVPCLLGLCFALAAGCGGGRTARLPDGSEGFSVNCNGMDSDWAECYNQAADMCDGGKYQIMSQNTSAVGEIPMRNLIIKCD